MKKIKEFNNSASEQWADEVMQSLEGIKGASCNPFLYTKVKAKIESRYGIWEKMANLITKPVFAYGSIVLFVAINVAVVTLGFNKKEEQLVVKSASEQMLAAEFTNIQQYPLVEINVEK